MSILNKIANASRLYDIIKQYENASDAVAEFGKALHMQANAYAKQSDMSNQYEKRAYDLMVKQAEMVMNLAPELKFLDEEISEVLDGKESLASNQSTKDKMLTIASWLESPENEMLINADYSDESLGLVAATFVNAAELIRLGAQELAQYEAPLFTPEKLNEIAAIAAAFDESGDELLQKQASVLDEILLTIAAPKNAVEVAKRAEDAKIDELKKKYRDAKTKQDDINKVSDAIKDIEKSKTYKTYRPSEAPLSQRYCIDHPGVSLEHLTEGNWKCPMDGKMYNWENGFSTLQNNKVPGGSVDMQTKMDQDVGHTVFDTRNSRLGLDGGESGK